MNNCNPAAFSISSVMVRVRAYSGAYPARSSAKIHYTSSSYSSLGTFNYVSCAWVCVLAPFNRPLMVWRRTSVSRAAWEKLSNSPLKNRVTASPICLLDTSTLSERKRLYLVEKRLCELPRKRDVLFCWGAKSPVSYNIQILDSREPRTEYPRLGLFEG